MSNRRAQCNLKDEKRKTWTQLTSSSGYRLSSNTRPNVTLSDGNTCTISDGIGEQKHGKRFHNSITRVRDALRMDVDDVLPCFESVSHCRANSNTSF